MDFAIFCSFYLMTRFFVTSAAGLKLQNCRRARGHGAARARRSPGVTQDSTLYHDPRHLLDEALVDHALTVVVYFPLAQRTDVNEPGLLEANGPDLKTPVSSAKWARLERPRLFEQVGQT